MSRNSTSAAMCSCRTSVVGGASACRFFPKNHIFDIVPDWVCEVISPSSGRLDRLKKMPIYAREGVGHAWIIDPDLQTLEVFRGEGDGWHLLATHGENEVVRVVPFEEIEINLAYLWGPPPA